MDWSEDDDRLEFVWLGAAVFSGLSLLGAVGAILSAWPSAVVFMIAMVFVWAAMAWGLRARRRWAWWLAMIVTGTLTATAVVGTLAVWFSIATGDSAGQHGIGAAGAKVLGALLPLFATVGAAVLWTLFRSRRLFGSP